MIDMNAGSQLYEMPSISKLANSNFFSHDRTNRTQSGRSFNHILGAICKSPSLKHITQCTPMYVYNVSI